MDSQHQEGYAKTRKPPLSRELFGGILPKATQSSMPFNNSPFKAIHPEALPDINRSALFLQNRPFSFSPQVDIG